MDIMEIINEFKQFKEVKAIAFGGSCTAKTSDSASDIDVYIFVNKDISVDERTNLIKKYSSRYETGGEYFGSGDEFYVDKLNKQLDVMYWNSEWFENIVDNIWIKRYPANGYTTAFLYTLKNFEIIYDPKNWLKNLKDKINTEYPVELQRNIIHRNLMLLMDKPFASYYEQLEKAVQRNDINSINHRTAAFLASYFDIIFALNKLLHPGEKRLVNYALKNCKLLPDNFEKDVNELAAGKISTKLITAKNMVENLRKIL